MTAFSSDTLRGCTSFTTLYTNEATKVAGHVQLPPGVTYLSSYNFYQTKVTHVFAPSVTSISGNGNTFAGNTLLKEVHLPSLRSVTAGAAFSGCTALQTVEISSGLSGTLAANTFSGCTSLESGYQSGNEPVEGLVDLPAGVTKLEWASFQKCKSIKHVVAPGVADVQNRGFTGCSALVTVRFSPDLAVLHNNGNWDQAAFYGCTALVDFYPSTIPNLTHMRASMFQGDAALTNAFDFSGATLSDVNGSSFFNGAKNVPCVRLPASTRNSRSIAAAYTWNRGARATRRRSVYGSVPDRRTDAAGKLRRICTCTGASTHWMISRKSPCRTQRNQRACRAIVRTVVYKASR